MISKINLNSILNFIVLFFAVSEPAIVVKGIGDKKSDFYVMFIVAAFAVIYDSKTFRSILICKG